MRKIEKHLLEHLGFRELPEFVKVGNFPGQEMLEHFKKYNLYSLEFNGISFREVINLSRANSDHDFNFVYAGFEVIISHDEKGVLMGEVFDSDEYRNNPEEPEIAQFVKLPLMEALKYIEDKLKGVKELEDIDDLPFPETVVVEKADLEELFRRADYNEIGSETLTRVEKVLE